MPLRKQIFEGADLGFLQILEFGEDIKAVL